MDADRLSEAIAIELKLARTLLQMATSDMDDPSDPDGVTRVVDHAKSALELVKRFLPAAKLSVADREYYRQELSQIEAMFQADLPKDARAAKA